jgi:dTMP kinase
VSRGRFITLEGGEGAGKSTLLNALGESLRTRGVPVVLTREPGGTPAADAVRELLVRGDSDRWSVLSEALLFAAARNDHLERLIRPSLTSGSWVISDRYMDSTAAYQVGGRGLPQETFDTLHSAINAEKPDLTLVLDVHPHAGVARSRGHASGESRFEQMDEAFHARVRAAFHDIALREPQRCVIIDATLSKAEVLAAPLAALDARLRP